MTLCIILREIIKIVPSFLLIIGSYGIQYTFSPSQVYIGPYRSCQVEVHTVRDLSGLKEGQLVAVHCEEGTEPAIARIRTIDEDTLNVI